MSDEISIDNQDLVTPANSSHTLVGLNSPKATISFLPEESWYFPQVALSFGKSFFREDPRTGSATGQDTAISRGKDQRRSKYDDCRRIYRANHRKLRYELSTWVCGSSTGSREPHRRGRWGAHTFPRERELHLQVWSLIWRVIIRTGFRPEVEHSSREMDVIRDVQLHCVCRHETRSRSPIN